MYWNVEQILFQNEGTFGLCNSFKKCFNFKLSTATGCQACSSKGNCFSAPLKSAATWLWVKTSASKKKCTIWIKFYTFWRRNRTVKIREAAALLVLSKPSIMHNGAVYNAAEWGFCLLFYKNYRPDISNTSSLCTASQVWVTKNIQQPAAAHILKYAFSWHWILKSFC